MKKYLLILLFVLTFIISACSAYDENPDTSIYADLYFDMETLTYTHLEGDILDGLSTPADDFFILYESYYGYAIKADDRPLYEAAISYLTIYQATENISYEALLNYSSKELNDALNGIGINLSIDHIVIFNELKAFSTLLIEEDFKSSISKLDYLRIRLERPLSNVEINALIQLQNAYTTILYDMPTYRLFDQDFQFFIDTLSQLGRTYDEDTLVALELAYNLLLTLK